MLAVATSEAEKMIVVVLSKCGMNVRRRYVIRRTEKLWILCGPRKGTMLFEAIRA